MNDKIAFSGAPTFKLVDGYGAIKTEFTVPNLIVSTGKAYAAARLVGTSVPVMTHMAVGTGTTSAASANTSLETETARELLTSSTVSAATVTYTAEFGPGVGTGPITEAGIFNASSAGTMLCRSKFAVFNKDAADTLYISWAVVAN